MVNQALIDWIKKEKAKGFSSEQMVKSLVQRGYKQDAIDEAMRVGTSAKQVNEPTVKFNYLPIVIIWIVVICLMVMATLIYFWKQN